MSKPAIEVLQTLDFLDKVNKVGDLSRLDSAAIRERLHYYHDFRLRTAPREANIHHGGENDLASLHSSASSVLNLRSVLPSCLTCNRVYVNDPLVRLGRRESEHSRAHKEAIGLREPDLPDRALIESKLKFFEEVAPLIQQGVINVLPLEELHAPTGEGTPVYFSEDAFRSEVPEHVHDFVHNSARLMEIAPTPKGGRLMLIDRKPQKPTSGIAVKFENDSPVEAPDFYLYHRLENIKKVDDKHYEFEQWLDWSAPPSKEEFETWAYQSINRTIINRLRTIEREIAIASIVNAAYLTESGFEAKLCGLSGAFDQPTSPQRDAVNFLRVNASMLRLESAETVAKFRESCPRQFDRWQESLLGVACELSGTQIGFEAKAQRLFAKEIQPQLEEMSQSFSRLCCGIGGGILISGATIGLAILSGGAVPFATTLGLGASMVAGQNLPSVSDYLKKRRGPAFIWSKLSK